VEEGTWSHDWSRPAQGRRQVYFVDAAHFVFAPFLGCLCAAARLFVRAASGRKRYNVLGALDAVTHRLIRVTNHGYINAESVCALLRAVAEAAVGSPITRCWTTRGTRSAPWCRPWRRRWGSSCCTAQLLSQLET